MSSAHVLIAAAATLLGTVVACVPAPATRADGVVDVLIPAWPANLDPRFAADAWSEKIGRLVYAPLLDRAPDGAIVPLLADSHWFEEPILLRVRLREEARFSDGSPLTAEDVVATFEAIADPALGSPKRTALAPIERVEALGAREVLFRLREPHAPILSVLASVGIASRAGLAAAEASGGMPSTGSGPFVFEEIARDRHVVLRRNELWQGGAPPSERLRFRVVPDSTVRALELLAGAADLTQNDLPPHVVDRLAADPELAVEQGPSTLVKYLVFHTRRPPLDDARVRRAVVRGLDVRALVAQKLRGQGRPSDSFFAPGTWAHSDVGAAWTYDPEEARRLLDEAGLAPGPDGVRVRLLYRTSQDETSVAVAGIMRRQLRAIGVELDVRSTEWGVFFADIQHGDFDLYTITGVGLHDPDWFTFVLDSRSIPPNGANRGRFVAPELDALLAAGRREADLAARAAIYRDAQALIADALPIVPLWHADNVVVRRRSVRGYVPRPDGLVDALATTSEVP